jgi:sulfur transfer protein SufE
MKTQLRGYLTARETRVLQMRAENKSFTEIGLEFQITSARARTVFERAKKVKAFIESDKTLEEVLSLAQLWAKAVYIKLTPWGKGKQNVQNAIDAYIISGLIAPEYIKALETELKLSKK